MVHPRTERGERALRMIACGRRLDNARGARGLEAGQQDGALDLGTRHLRFVRDAPQACTGDGERRPAVSRRNPCTHARQRIDYAAHRPSVEAGVATDDGLEWRAPRRCRTTGGASCRNCRRRAAFAAPRGPAPRAPRCGSGPVRWYRSSRRGRAGRRASRHSRLPWSSRKSGSRRQPGRRGARSGGRWTCLREPGRDLPRRPRATRGPRLRAHGTTCSRTIAFQLERIRFSMLFTRVPSKPDLSIRPVASVRVIA